MDAEPASTPPHITSGEDVKFNLLTRVLFRYEVYRFISHACFFVFVVMFGVKYTQKYGPWITENISAYWSKTKELFNSTIKAILNDDYFEDENDSTEYTDDEESDDDDYSEPMPAEKAPEGWEMIGKNPYMEDDTGSEYDTSSEDRVSLSSMDDIENDQKTKEFRRFSKRLLSKIVNDACSCECHHVGSEKDTKRKNNKKTQTKFSTPEAVLRIRINRAMSKNKK